jgi:uncharacterized protein YcnI
MKNRALTGALVVAGVAMLVAAPMASAHVTVNPGEAVKGGFAALAFRVPNERDDAGTTSLVVSMPEDYPIPNVSVKPKAGWTYTITPRTLEEPIDNHGEQITEVVGTITWTGGTINPGEFDEFEVSVGPLPEEPDMIAFPSVQTYSSGEEVRWIDEEVEGEEEPEHPVPTLKLIEGSGDHDETAAEAEADEASSSAEQASGVTVSNVSQDDVDQANTLATVGLVVGGLGLIVAIVAVVLGRRKAGGSGTSTPSEPSAPSAS